MGRADDVTNPGKARQRTAMERRVSKSDRAAIAVEIAKLASAKINELRKRWTILYGRRHRARSDDPS